MTRDRVVFDCNVYLQALANPSGPAGRCLKLWTDGEVTLCASPHVLDELRSVTNRPAVVRKLGFLPERADELLRELLQRTVIVTTVPIVFEYERDPDDAHYVNLALAAGARLIVSRDNDRLALSDQSTVAGRDFAGRFPMLSILTPPAFLRWTEEQHGE